MGSFLNIALAQESSSFFGQIVTCEGIDCGKTELLEMIVRIFQFGIDISFLIAVVFFVIGGVMILVSGGNEKLLTRGKEALKAAVIGLLIVLLAWVFINTLIVFFTKCTGKWYIFESLTCG